MLSAGRFRRLLGGAVVFFLLLLCWLLLACSHKSPKLGYVILSYYENPTWCDGCPKFQLDFSERGNVTLRCFAGCSVPGVQNSQIPEAEFDRLVSAFHESGFFKIARLDTNRVVLDATIVRLTYRDEHGVHETIDDGRNIGALTQLKRQLRDAVPLDSLLKTSLAMYRRLVDSGWDVNTVGEDQQNALSSAVQAGDLDCVHFLLRHDSRVTQQALVDSSFSDNPQLVNALLDATHLEVRSALGGELLRNAAAHNANVTRFLLSRGADANSQDPESGRTPLMFAVSSGSFENVLLLLGSGADVNLGDHDGRTALWFAATQLNSGFITLLVRSGSKVNSQDRDGRTALMQATEGCFYWNVAPLLEAGADESLDDKRGHAALDLPTPANEPKCVTTLNLLKSTAGHMERQNAALLYSHSR